jgi:tRNA threonylcarbamoyladenosine biosynthesis protein TsaB
LPALAIDTATEVLALALAENGAILAESSIDAGRSHLELLLTAVHKLLEENSMTIRDVDAIAAGTGPGTFSGLRVGIATARALAQTLKVPLTGFSTLESLALELAGDVPFPESPMIMPLIDAKRGQVFTQFFRKEGENRVTPESEILCLDPDQLLEMQPRMTWGDVRAGGNGATAYHDLFAQAKNIDLLTVDDPRNRVRAVWHLRAVKDGNIFDPRQLLAVVPFYVREPDADRTILLRKKEPWLK